MDTRLRYEFEPLEFEFRMDSVADAAVDSKGNIFALAGVDQPVSVFDGKGRFLSSWGKGIIREGHGIFIDPGDFVYVADSGDHVVSKFTHDGKHLFTIGNRGTHSGTGAVNGNFKTITHSAGPFYSPSKVTVSPAGEIFVTDGYGNARIHRFSAEGRLIKSWGEPGGGPGQLRIPHGIGVDEENTVYVADRENDRVQVFDAEGALKAIWNGIHRPDGLCLGGGLVYVAELGHIMYVDNVMYEPYENMPWSKVRVFDRNGTELARFGGPEGWKAGNLFAAHSINIDRQGNVYVGEAAWPANEQPVPEGLHPALQKFKKLS